MSSDCARRTTFGGGRPKKRSYVQRLQVDFLSKMLADRSIVSVPICDDALLAEARQGRLSEADAILHRGEADYQFFELVDVRVGEKHQVNTTAYRATRAMVFPVSLQRLRRWVDHAEDGLVVLREGSPEVVDLVDEVAWPMLVGGLRQWRHRLQADGVSVLLDNPISLQSREWDVQKQMPAVIALDRLYNEGWVHGTPPLVHTLTDKVFKVKDAVTSWAYLHCLLDLGRLALVDGFELSSMESNLYYQCVLTTKDQCSIPRGQSARAYRALLALDDGEPEVQPLMGPLGVADDECDDLVMSLVVEPERLGQRGGPFEGQALQRLRKRARGQRKALEQSDERPDLVWGGVLVPRSIAESPSTSLGGPADGHVVHGEVGQSQMLFAGGEVGLSDGATAASSGLHGVGSMMHDGADLDDGLLVSSPQAHADIFVGADGEMRLEGVKVSVERHGVEGHGKNYRRYRVCCPVPHHQGRCQRSRTFSQADITDLDRLAELGVWLAAGPCFETRAQHVAFKPSRAEIDAYRARLT